jgi:ACS family glucarate transporter-like MFS transporter
MSLTSAVPSPVATQPTRVRYKVVSMTLMLAMITYLDRACIGTVAPDIMRDLSLSKEQMSWVFTVFAISYALFEIPTAWWADRLGTRSTLTRIVLWWSAFTMLTAAAFNYVSMLIVRFLFGAGEAGAWPCVARTFARWIPLAERGRIQGIFFAGAHLAGAVTPTIVVAMMTVVSWHFVFVVFGLLGVIWSIAWYRWFRDEPSDHPAVNRAEVEKILAGRQVGADHGGGSYWGRLFSHRNTVALCLAYMPTSAAFYFCITWLPTFLKEKHGFSSVTLGVLSGLPLFLAVFGDIFGGVATDSAVRKLGLKLGRIGVGVVGNGIAALCMILAAYVAQPVLAAVFLSLAVAAAMFTLGAAWGTCLDIGGEHVGVVSAAMNTAGQVASIPSPLLVTFLVSRFNDWNAPLYVMGAFFAFGAANWLLIDPRKPVFGPAAA